MIDKLANGDLDIERLCPQVYKPRPSVTLSFSEIGY
jgi:hypothetical protein